MAGSRYLCEEDARAVAETFASLIGTSSWTADDHGVGIDFGDIVEFLQRVTSNPVMRTFELTTEEHLFRELRSMDRDVLRVVRGLGKAS